MRLVDRDTREVMDLLRGAVVASGMSQAGLAQALGTSASRLSTYISGQTRPSAQFCMRARRLGRALRAANEQRVMSAPATGAAMREYFLAGEDEWIWRMLLQGRDQLALMLADRDQILIDSWEAEPGSVGAVGWDTLLAAVVFHEFEHLGIEAPPWSRTDALMEPWVPEHPFLSRERVVAQTPDWLRRFNIYVPIRDLVTA